MKDREPGNCETGPLAQWEKDYLDRQEVDHPSHYNWHPAGIEAIDVVEEFPYNIGTVIAYLWRAGRKGPPLTDLRKAVWHLNREIERLEKQDGEHRDH